MRDESYYKHMPPRHVPDFDPNARGSALSFNDASSFVLTANNAPRQYGTHHSQEREDKSNLMRFDNTMKSQRPQLQGKYSTGMPLSYSPRRSWS